MESSSAEGLSIIFLLIFGLVGLVSFVLWIWSLIHCIRNKYLSDTNRIVGILLIVLLGLIGSLIYLFLPREGQAQR